MIRYVETSALTRWLFGGEHRDAIAGALAAPGQIVASRLTVAEANRTVVRLLATGAIDEGIAARAREAIALLAARWTVVGVADDLLMRAGQPFPAEPIRALDAIHLATALTVREAAGELEVVSTDERVRANARLLGFPVLP
ncbi:MAG: type II toxin-antitoxin system VapC family toxin [Myxococcota bacterium]